MNVLAFAMLFGQITLPTEPQSGSGSGATRLHDGVVLFTLTAAVAVLVQPFAEFVIVTVNVPEHVTLGFALFGLTMKHGPDQLKLVPDVVEAERTTDVVVQVNVPPVALAPGGAVL